MSFCFVRWSWERPKDVYVIVSSPSGRELSKCHWSIWSMFGRIWFDDVPENVWATVPIEYGIMTYFNMLHGLVLFSEGTATSWWRSWTLGRVTRCWEKIEVKACTQRVQRVQRCARCPLAFWNRSQRAGTYRQIEGHWVPFAEFIHWEEYCIPGTQRLTASKNPLRLFTTFYGESMAKHGKALAWIGGLRGWSSVDSPKAAQILVVANLSLPKVYSLEVLAIREIYTRSWMEDGCFQESIWRLHLLVLWPLHSLNH